MSPLRSTTTQDLDLDEVLQLINADSGSFTCVAEALTQHRRCRRHNAQWKYAAIKDLICRLPQVDGASTELRRILYQIADLSVCYIGTHQQQKTQIVERWYQALVTEKKTAEKPAAEPCSAEDDLLEELRRLRRENAELRRREADLRHPSSSSSTSRIGLLDEQTETSNKDRQRQSQEERLRNEQTRREQRDREKAQREKARKEEARRQAQREREQQGADAQQRREREDARRRGEELRQRREREARTRREEEANSWNDAWARYERDWANLAHIDTMTLAESVKDSLPWPVKDGRWQDVDEANVYAFLRHAPKSAWQDPDDFLAVLKAQARRWHPDRIGRQFPTCIADGEVGGLVTLVTQVVNRERAKARERGGRLLQRQDCSRD